MNSFPKENIIDESAQTDVTEESQTTSEPSLLEQMNEESQLLSKPREPEPGMSKVLRPRHRILALMLARGDRNKDICKALGYDPSRVSILANNPMIQAEVLRIQNSIYEKTVDERMKDLSTAAVDAVEEALLPDNPDAKERTTTAKWVIEKLTGKAAQQVNHNGEIAIGIFVDEVKKLTEVSERRTQTIDAEVRDSEENEIEVDDHTKWLEKHLD